MDTIGTRLRQIRVINNLRQEDMSEIMGFSRGHISRIERGGALSKRAIKQYCVEFEVDEDWLRHGEGTPPAPSVPNTLHARMAIRSRGECQVDSGCSVVLNFAGHEDLLETLRVSAQANVRTLEQEIIFTCKEKQ